MIYGILIDCLSQYQVQDSHQNEDIHHFCCHGCKSFQRYSNFTDCDPFVLVHAFGHNTAATSSIFLAAAIPEPAHCLPVFCPLLFFNTNLPLPICSQIRQEPEAPNKRLNKMVRFSFLVRGGREGEGGRVREKPRAGICSTFTWEFSDVRRPNNRGGIHPNKRNVNPQRRRTWPARGDPMRLSFSSEQEVMNTFY